MQEFAEAIKKAIEDLNPNLRIYISTINKNNGLKLTGVSIINEKESSRIAPNIYLNEYFKEYNEGIKDMGEIVNDIMSVYYQHKDGIKFDENDFLDYHVAKNNLSIRLINYEKNKEMLEGVPYRMFNDLAIIYYVSAGTDKDCVGAITVRNEHIKHWNISEEQLYNDAMNNFNSETFKVAHISEMLISMGMPEEDVRRMGDAPMIVVTNQSGCFGASAMLSTSAMNHVYNEFVGDFYIIPSSVHEIIAVNINDMDTDIDALSAMVKEVNATQVAPHEVLSDSVYVYNSETEKVELAVV